MNCINRFQKAQSLSVSVGNSYSYNEFIHIFSDNFHQGVKYTEQIAIHKVQLKIEESFTDKKLYLLRFYRLII